MSAQSSTLKTDGSGISQAAGTFFKLIIAASIVARCIAAFSLDIGVDEAYAIALARTFDLSYFDHPPFAFWIVAATHWLTGSDAHPFFWRLPFLVMGLISLRLVYLIARKVFDADAGLLAAAAFACSPFFAIVGGTWILPDGPLDLFLLLAVWALLPILLEKTTKTPQWRNWLLAGLFFGLALMSKYHALLAGIGLFVWLLTSKTGRCWLAKPQPYIAAFIALLVFSPVLIWNVQHEFASFAYQLGRGAPSSRSPIVGLLNSLMGQALYLGPFLFFILPLAFAGATADRRAKTLFAALGLPVIILFTLVVTWGGKNLPHWQMPGWLMLFPVLGMALARWREALVAIILTLSAGLTAIALASVMALQAGLAPAGMSATLHPFYVETTSWRRASNAITELGIEFGPNDFLVANQWHTAARASEALPKLVPIIVLADRPTGFSYVVDQNEFVGANGYYLTRLTQDTEQFNQVASQFDRVEMLGQVPLTIGEQKIFTINVYRLIDFSPD